MPGSQESLVRRLRQAGCVYAEEEARLLAAAAAGPRLEALVLQRERGIPLEQVLGWAEFCGLRVGLRPGVFVPRRRSELLARRAVAETRASGVAVELCCGAGAVSLVLAHAAPAAELYAVDLDPVAVACAADNLGSRAEVLLGDLDTPLPGRLRGRVDVLVANAPYVPTAAVALMPAEARDHEPLLALDGGADGLAVLRRVVRLAPRWLAPGGRLLVECGEEQVLRLTAVVRAAGLVPTVAHHRELRATVVVARRPRRLRPAGRRARAPGPGRPGRPAGSRSA